MLLEQKILSSWEAENTTTAKPEEFANSEISSTYEGYRHTYVRHDD